ncbi:GNAT family N-acetyltransferase [Mucilaginibacter sp. 22184]|uniref:GNAT family N-acetyltransferase n=1 Tax=Mucilaginibacter sp. 22184 TaxID=3453887 RepID=UPI003F827B1D
MITIKTLKEFTLADQHSFGFSGYHAHEIYQLSRTQHENEFTIKLTRVKLEQPYIKRWTYTQEDTDHYAELITEKLSLGAFENDRLIGVAIAQKRAWNNSLWVDYIEVADSHRKMGIGTLLLNRMTLTATEQKIRLIELETQSTNTPAIDFYLKNGFEICGVHSFLYDPASVPEQEKAILLGKLMDG